MKTMFLKMLLICFTFGTVLYSCSDDDNDENGSKKESMPEMLSAENSIVLSRSSPLGFGYFRVTGLAEGQWASKEIPTISPNFSTATFTYQVTGENTATLESLNRQVLSSGTRYWSITLDLTFNTHNSGDYTLFDTALSADVSYTTHGTFILK